MRSLILLIIAASLAGCASSQNKAHPDPSASSADCTEEERRAREIALLVTVRYDLDALTRQLRNEIALRGAIDETDPAAAIFADGWVYHGNGSIWFFRSGDWAMLIDQGGAGPIHFTGNIPGQQLDVRVDVIQSDGRFQFANWHVEKWEFIDFGCSFGFDADFVPDCNFAIPVGAR